VREERAWVEKYVMEIDQYFLFDRKFFIKNNSTRRKCLKETPAVFGFGMNLSKKKTHAFNSQ